jgi:hypothetical protein
MRAIKIDVVNKTITEIQIDKNNTLKEMQAVVGGLITVACELENVDALMVNDEGLFMFPDFFFFEGNCQPNAGNGILVGTDMDGNTVDCKTSLEEVKAKVRFLDKAGALKLAQEMGC